MRQANHSRIRVWIVGVVGIAMVLCLGIPTFAGVQVYTVEQSYGPYRLAGETLQQMPAGMVPVGFEDSVWVLGYSTEILSGDGDVSSTDLHCHTVMSSSIASLHPESGSPFRGVFSDGFTKRIKLPRGYGLYYEAGEEISVIPMFNNRAESVVDASMKIKIDFVRAEDLAEPLTPLYSTTISIANPDLYMVPPGVDVRELEFSLPYSGTIQAMGVHIHPYGRSVELMNTATRETVWKAVGIYGDDGRLTEMPFFSTSSEGYPFGPEDRFLLRATYQNPTDVEQDAMAGLFILFATEDGLPPAEARVESAGETGMSGAGAHSGH